MTKMGKMNAQIINFGDSMISYDDLCKAYDTKNKENHAKAMKIRKLYRGLANAIATDLGLFGKSFKNVKDDSPYIKFGTVEFDDFKPVLSEYELPVNISNAGLFQINGAISVTLESSPNAYPKQAIFIRIDAELKEDSLVLAFPDKEHMNFNLIIHENNIDYSDVVVAYKQIVMDVLSK